MEVDQQQPQRAVKRSLVEVFLEEEGKQNKKSTNIARLELARAENRKEKNHPEFTEIKTAGKKDIGKYEITGGRSQRGS